MLIILLLLRNIFYDRALIFYDLALIYLLQYLLLFIYKLHIGIFILVFSGPLLISLNDPLLILVQGAYLLYVVFPIFLEFVEIHMLREILPPYQVHISHILEVILFGSINPGSFCHLTSNLLPPF